MGDPQNKKTLVMKFGGTSVGSSYALSQVTKIIRDAKAEWDQIVVVISAMSGVTNLLLGGWHGEDGLQGQNGEKDPQSIYLIARQLREKHYVVVDEMISAPARNAQIKKELDHLINSYIRLCQAVDILGELTPRALDAIGSLGERMSVRVLAAIFEMDGIPSQFVEATQLIVTDNNFQAARPDFDKTEFRIHSVLPQILEKGIVPVVTGFIGATSDGVTTTLGRGGSDYSAAIIGALLPADEVWIWTDVDGVMTADPRIVPDAKTVSELSYREVSELAYFGAKVLHPKTIRPIVEKGIGLRVKNTFQPEHSGTRIVDQINASGTNQVIKAVTAIRGQTLITVEGRGMLGVPGVAANVFGAVAKTGTSVILISQASSEQSICFAVPVGASALVVDALKSIFKDELEARDIDKIWATDEIVIITVVGVGLQYTPGVAAKVFGALGEENINVIAIAQGSSEAAISLVVDAADMKQAVISLHNMIERQ